MNQEEAIECRQILAGIDGQYQRLAVKMVKDANFNQSQDIKRFGHEIGRLYALVDKLSGAKDPRPGKDGQTP
jgi:nitrogen-specific signal transduction histidine kinase